MIKSVTLAYDQQAAPNTSYTQAFTNFTGEDLPRSFADAAALSVSASGASIMSGPSYAVKRIWALEALVSEAEALNLYNLYLAWDADRASGLNAVVGVSDDTFGDTVSTSAVFSTPPSFSGNGPSRFVSFGLSEV